MYKNARGGGICYQVSMASRFPYLLLHFSLLFVTLFRWSVATDAENFIDNLSEGEGLLIREVTDHDDGFVFTEKSLRNADHHFSIFKRKFGRTYASEGEHDYRFKVFKTNLRRAVENQRLDPSAFHGITKFSDLTVEEFQENFLGIKEHRPLQFPSDAHKAPILPIDDLPKNFDWRDHGAVTPVKNQGTCGSCWTFSTTGALEGANYLATGKLVSLSEQQLVDCDHECDPEERGSCDSGCNGGLMNTAFEYTFKAGGLMREEDYPYSGRDGGACKFNKNSVVAKVANFSVVSVDQNQMAANLVKNGPLAVGINAAFMQTYIGGVSCPFVCDKGVNHGVLIVGYGDDGYSQIRFKKKPYWIIKNSWGENWGENGYYRICRGRNICGVDSLVSTVTAVTK